jgi:hypothetical protein
MRFEQAETRGLRDLPQAERDARAVAGVGLRRRDEHAHEGTQDLVGVDPREAMLGVEQPAGEPPDQAQRDLGLAHAHRLDRRAVEAQHAGGADGGGAGAARRALDRGDLAEELAGSEAGDAARPTGPAARELDLPRLHDEELVARLALLEDDLARREHPLVRVADPKARVLVARHGRGLRGAFRRSGGRS